MLSYCSAAVKYELMDFQEVGTATIKSLVEAVLVSINNNAEQVVTYPKQHRRGPYRGCFPSCILWSR